MCTFCVSITYVVLLLDFSVVPAPSIQNCKCNTDKFLDVTYDHLISQHRSGRVSDGNDSATSGGSVWVHFRLKVSAFVM